MENLTGGTPPVRPLPCVVPCKLYFTKRNDTLTREIHKVQAAENELLKKQGAQKDIHDVEKEIIPTTQHILDSYPQLSVEEKNRLWKIVMERITAYRTPGGEVSIHIYPKLPMR